MDKEEKGQQEDQEEGTVYTKRYRAGTGHRFHAAGDELWGTRQGSV